MAALDAKPPMPGPDATRQRPTAASQPRPPASADAQLGVTGTLTGWLSIRLVASTAAAPASNEEASMVTSSTRVSGGGGSHHPGGFSTPVNAGRARGSCHMAQLGV